MKDFVQLGWIMMPSLDQVTRFPMEVTVFCLSVFQPIFSYENLKLSVISTERIKHYELFSINYITSVEKSKGLA